VGALSAPMSELMSSSLHLAVESGDVDAVLAEIGKGTDLELGTPGFNETALHRAAEQGNLEVVSALIESNADVNARRRGGFTALHLAATEAVADALLAAGVDPSIRAANGFTAMQQCAGGAAVRFHISASPGPAKLIAAEAAAAGTTRTRSWSDRPPTKREVSDWNRPRDVGADERGCGPRRSQGGSGGAPGPH
jgi:hypothetical protein